MNRLLAITLITVTSLSYAIAHSSLPVGTIVFADKDWEYYVCDETEFTRNGVPDGTRSYPGSGPSYGSTAPTSGSPVVKPADSAAPNASNPGIPSGGRLVDEDEECDDDEEEVLAKKPTSSPSSAGVKTAPKPIFEGCYVLEGDDDEECECDDGIEYGQAANATSSGNSTTPTYPGSNASPAKAPTQDAAGKNKDPNAENDEDKDDEEGEDDSVINMSKSAAPRPLAVPLFFTGSMVALASLLL